MTAPGPRPRTWVLFLGLAALLCWDRVLGPYALVRLFDSFETLFPLYRLEGAEFLRHGFFDWLPWLPGGMPAYAFHHPPFYPLNLASALLPLWLVSAALDIFSFLLAGWGLHRMSRRFLGLSEPASAVASVLFVLSLATMLRHFLLAFAFPACFVWTAQAVDQGLTRGRRFLSGLAVVLVLSLAYPVLTLPLAVVHFLLVLALPPDLALNLDRPGKERRARLGGVLAVWTGYALLCAPVLLALHDFAPLAHRSNNGTIVSLWAALREFARMFALQLWEEQLCFPFLILGLPLLARNTRGQNAQSPNTPHPNTQCRKARVLFLLVLALAGLRAFGNSDLRFLLSGSFLGMVDWGLFFQLTPMALALLAALVLDAARERTPGLFWVLAALGLTVATGRFQSEENVLYQVFGLGAGLAAMGLIAARRIEMGRFSVGRTATGQASAGEAATGQAATGRISSGRAWSERTSAERAAAERAAAEPRATEPEGRDWLGRFPRALVPVLSLCLTGAALLAVQHSELNFSHAPYAQGFTPEPRLIEDPDGPFRVGCVDLHPILALAQGLEPVDFKGPLFAKDYKDYFRAVVAPQLARPEDRARFDRDVYHLFLGQGSLHRDFFLRQEGQTPRKAGDFNLDLLSAMNVRYLLSAKPIEGLAERCGPPRLKKLGGLAGLGALAPAGLQGTALDRFYSLPVLVYRLPQTLGRAFLATRVQVLPDSEAVLAAMSSAGMDRLRRTVFFRSGDLERQAKADPTPMPWESDLLAPEPAPPSMQYGTDRLVIEGRTPGPAYLVVSNNHNPGWTALVNGAPVPVLRANGAFQAVPLDRPGPYRVELSFVDRTARLGLLLALAGLGLMLVPALIGPILASPALANSASRLTPPGLPARRAGRGQESLKPEVSPGIPPEPGRPRAPEGTAPGSAPSHRAAIWGAWAMTLVWVLTFLLFIYARQAPKNDGRPLTYVLWMTPPVGLMLGLWVRAMLRRFPPSPRTDLNS